MQKMIHWFSTVLLVATFLTTLVFFSLSATPLTQAATHTSPHGWCCIKVAGQPVLKAAGLCT